MWDDIVKTLTQGRAGAPKAVILIRNSAASDVTVTKGGYMTGVPVAWPKRQSPSFRPCLLRAVDLEGRVPHRLL